MPILVILLTQCWKRRIIIIILRWIPNVFSSWIYYNQTGLRLSSKCWRASGKKWLYIYIYIYIYIYCGHEFGPFIWLMLRAILNKSWQQHPTRHQLYGHLPPITKTIQIRRTRHAGHCWRSRDELIRDVLLWIPTHGRAKAGRPARTYIQQLCEDTGCCPEDLPWAMNDREEWRERVRDIRAASTIWWWWWWWFGCAWKVIYSGSVEDECTLRTAY